MYRSNRKFIDYRVRAVRHCDDIQDMVLKVKSKAQELIDKIKSMPIEQKEKLISYLKKIIALVSLLYSAKTANDLRKNIKAINTWKNAVGSVVGGPGAFDSMKRGVLIKQGFKVLIGLVTAIVAYASEKFTKASVNPEEEVSV